MTTKPVLIVLSVLLAMVLVSDALVSRAESTRSQGTKVNYQPIPGGEYKIDPAHSVIGFSIRHLEINWVEGRFNNFSGTIRYDDQDITKSSVEFSAKVDSIDTGVERRDNHLRSADFFEVAKYPDLNFKSTRVERQGKNYVLHGDLTLKGVTKPVSLPFSLTGAIKDSGNNTRIGVSAETKVDRRDFGITYGKALPIGGFDIGNEVMIEIHLEALQPAPKPAAGQ